jgi:DNA-binding response OmpR family regulator
MSQFIDLRKIGQEHAPVEPGNSARRTDLSTSVLVIDDDIAMTEMLKMILEPKSFEVFSAKTAEEGIEAARRKSPDVIVLDLHIPESDGWQVCRSIRNFSKTPILVLSALNKPGAVAQALDEGADDYLIKPVPSGVLIAHLKNLTRRARAEKEAYASRPETPVKVTKPILK